MNLKKTSMSMEPRHSVKHAYTSIGNNYENLTAHLEVLLDIRDLLKDQLDVLYEIRHNTF